LIFIIAVRLLVKSRRGSETLRSVTVLLDAFMLSLICNLGFGPSYHYLTALFAAAMAASDVLVVE
jgi:NADH:ubiquinone oxidoreductase subunit K